VKKSEVAKLLVFVQSADRRSAPDDLWVEVWHEFLAEVDYEAGMSAVRAHYRSASRPISPADILGIVETLAAPVPALASSVEADLLGIPDDEYLERLESDPGYLAELRDRIENGLDRGGLDV
jgi:hypothetical protein